MKKIFFLLLASTIITAFAQAQYKENSTFQDNELQTLRVPVGGIGTGNLLIGGRGNIEHVEVFNRPDRQRRLEKTFFSLWTKEKNKPSTVTLLERELFPPFLEVSHKYGGGLPRMSWAKLINNYPLLQWQFNDQSVPVDVSLEVISPLVPLDYEASSYPVCKFNWTISNPTQHKIEASIALSMENPIKAKEIISQFKQEGDVKGIQFASQKGAESVNYEGSFFIGTPASNIEVQTHWYPGTWRDETHIFWNDFKKDGHIENKKDKWITSYSPTSYNESTHRMSTVLVPVTLDPGEEISVPFYFSWYFPKRTFNSGEVFGIEEAKEKIFRNWYANRFKDELDALVQFRAKEKQILGKAEAFAQILSRSSLPDYVIEALNTQVATLASPLIQVTAEGNVHGFEGVLNTNWCCPGTCTHVWNYEQTLASLYPLLDRKMREIEFLNNTFEDGFQTHRAVLPVGDYWFNGPAAADGQMGTIVRAYREWKLSGDNEWLAKLWPKIKKALEFAWHGSGEPTREKTGNKQEPWDPGKTGLLSGKQHNTYDINFYGSSSMTTSLYLAALKAGSKMAEAMGEQQKSTEYLNVYQKGARMMADSLWNGDYFIQIIAEDSSLYGDNELSPPNLKGQEIPKYQYGNGCLADQLLGQYLSFVSGMGYIADKEKINKALMAVYNHNFKKSLRNYSNVQRVYGLNDEAGMVMCTWPKGDRPLLPFVYAQEIWTGVEYQVAASLIFSGHVKEGLRMVEAVQNRYNGQKRNPFEHIESGVHYARALSAWSVLLGLSGAKYDGVDQTLSFSPKINSSKFRSFWSTDSAWGKIIINQQEARIEVVHGNLSLKEIAVQNPNKSSMKIKNYDEVKTIPAGSELLLTFE